MYANIIVTVLLWTIYFFLHSFLAASKVKKFVCQNNPLIADYYRIMYSIVSILGLIPIFYFLAVTRSAFLVKQTEVLKYVSMALSTWGVIVIKQSFKGYSIQEFLGIKNQKEQLLIKSGLLKYVRHPLYSGTILLCLGFWLFIPNTLNLVSIISIFIYLFIGIRLEEIKLVKEFGEEYIAYRQEVPSILPDVKRIWDASQHSNS
ncbi:isoprenylcysteine carboxylmethyltransferase family protein [Reichenbachiella sp. MALMAid0571]|uniref:methyltransferase family protein n=1 Tax=Reichenbachiella sp. MALMAid0571 TaxID=3143939 RepID=UPI0032DFC678